MRNPGYVMASLSNNLSDFLGTSGFIASKMKETTRQSLPNINDLFNDKSVLAYAPYIPLITTGDVMTGPFRVTLPIWMGESKEGGFHETIDLIFRETPDPSDQDKMTIRLNFVNALVDFSSKHKGDQLKIPVQFNDGSVTNVVCKFDALTVILNAGDPDRSKWTTPVRLHLDFEKPSDVAVRQHRLEYGGQFYANGTADVSPTWSIGQQGTIDPKTGVVSMNDKKTLHNALIENISIKEIYWIDYKAGNTGVKLI